MSSKKQNVWYKGGEMAKRSARADFRITQEESEHLRQAAKDAGLVFSDYLRALTLDRTVLAVGPVELTVIPAATTSPEEDLRIEARIAELIRVAATGQAQSAPAPDETPAPATAPVVPTPAHSEPAPPSPSEPDGMAGASTSGSATEPAVGVATGRDAQNDPGSAKTCPHCGGRNGQHQSFCETITGESPVTDPAPTPGVETREQFVARRVSEGEIAAVAEAEWRQLSTGPAPDPAPVAAAAPAAAAPPPAALAPCPSCATMKNPAAQCRECGRRPDAYA